MRRAWLPRVRAWITRAARGSIVYVLSILIDYMMEKKDFLAVSELCFSISFGGALSWADLRRLFVTRARSVVLGFLPSVIHTSVPET
jgi:hypothetical protein